MSTFSIFFGPSPRYACAGEKKGRYSIERFQVGRNVRVPHPNRAFAVRMGKHDPYITEK
jgi:hypothetical protein